MQANENIPKDEGLDNSLTLMKEGYLFIKNRMDRYHTDIFETHLMGQKVICMTGVEAAKIFYDPERFQRKGAAPNRIQQTLFGANAIQTMDGEAHLHRKQQFMSLMTRPHQKELANMVVQEFEQSIHKWELAEQVNLFEESQVILCRVACNWAGIPIQEAEVTDRAKDFISMIYSFGDIGPEHWEGRRARNRVEDWIQQVIEDVRSDQLKPNQDYPLYAWANFKDIDGKRLDSKMAAIELINVIRPIVAIATYITFGALALRDYPQYQEKLQSRDPEELEMFAQEVRRFYPFGPFLAARVKKDFEWNNCQFEEGTLVLLDVFGLHNDPNVWEKPSEFRPERFQDREENFYDLIPQGGGDPNKGHRCPGEGITLEIMKASIDFLVNRVDYEIPAQDLSYSLSQMPTLPKSGFIINRVKQK
ncbi:cytochrome P450 [Salinibacillus xinjiangensis]|uniref:Cytochrome P450 n=1 Tax=Salinibacillus xinjiangensis TaxID=1229268 RepID=A0A6G1X545_9BACI|nr:cytochrome P450 [Salinibacillus xinjiangensis]MRG86123.1 cytochrome P450 [Salinibacillus xinjiangensis]